ncbi:sm-like protein LSM1B [Solanum pennellii]|uniref:U6 snRNA-associated Sm-like protein LSm1 n=1 Tax=Solanum pennellii TaxID=28526 RepID=A0ABM1FRZ7_SOLPN|nr:sm-like protein LSM1B [Solanum pennellii]
MSNWSDSNDYLFSSSLASYLDGKIIILLRDGRELLGTLRSFDQYANIVLEGTKERVIVGNLYCDISLGLYIVRGENVMLIGQRESDEEELPPHMTCVSEIEIKRVQKADKNAEELKGSTRRRMEFIDFD